MTDDFHLFADPNDGGEALDPDIALVSAYLARELSPMQVLALEERLATDAEFRLEMQPLIDAWAAPVPSLEEGLARRAAPLSPLERAESWRRFQAEGVTPAASTEPIPLDTPPRTTRRISMKRIALLIGAIGLPMVSFAQVVVYAAAHADFPGHASAQRIVSAFTNSVSDARTHAESTPATASNHLPSAIADAPVPRPLSAPKVGAAESAKATSPTVTPAPATALTSATPRTGFPNRALVAELIRRNQPELVRGDTTAEYVVMVLDAAESYVWSTIGNGNVSIDVGADPRTAGERAAFTAEHRDEFWGDAYATMQGVGGGRRGMNGGFGTGLGGRGRGGAGELRGDTAIIAPGRGGRGGLYAFRFAAGDTTYMLQYDSLFVRVAGGRGAYQTRPFVFDSAGGGYGRQGGRGAYQTRPFGFDSTGRGYGRQGGGGRGVFGSQASGSAAGTYRVGWPGMTTGVAVNHALGLQVPSAERSGVQGLSPSFVESAEIYFFAPRELTPSNVRVMVVRLTPSASWRGPS